MEITKRTYYNIYIILMVLLAATILVHYVPLGNLGIVVSLGIAVTKAILVMLYFMHIRFESGIVKLFAGAGFFWFLILLLITLSDYLTRLPVSKP